MNHRLGLEAHSIWTQPEKIWTQTWAEGSFHMNSNREDMNHRLGLEAHSIWIQPEKIWTQTWAGGSFHMNSTREDMNTDLGWRLIPYELNQRRYEHRLGLEAHSISIQPEKIWTQTWARGSFHMNSTREDMNHRLGLEAHSISIQPEKIWTQTWAGGSFHMNSTREDMNTDLGWRVIPYELNQRRYEHRLGLEGHSIWIQPEFQWWLSQIWLKSFLGVPLYVYVNMHMYTVYNEHLQYFRLQFLTLSEICPPKIGASQGFPPPIWIFSWAEITNSVSRVPCQLPTEGLVTES